MIGHTYKKFAAEHQMTVAKGIAYGSFYGYAATMCEGAGWKRIAVSCRFTDADKRDQLEAELNTHDLMKEFRVQELALCDDGIIIVFYDNPGTMKKLRAFCEWFFPTLSAYGVTGADICPECGQPITDNGSWKLVGEMAVHMHTACISRMQSSLDREAQMEAENNADKSYLNGLVGALIGALLGAVVWGGLMYAGFYASAVGVLIGVLTSKGYDITNGKQKVGKIFIVLIATILSVVVGTFGAYAASLAVEISSGLLPGYVMGDIPWMLLYLLQDPEFLRAAALDIALGLMYALLGAGYILLRVYKSTKDIKVQTLS